MSTGLESQYNGYESEGAIPTGPSPAESALHEELQRANEKLKAELAAARHEIEQERLRIERLRADAESRFDGKPSEIEQIESEMSVEREALRALRELRQGELMQSGDPYSRNQGASLDPGVTDDRGRQRQATNSGEARCEDAWAEDEVLDTNAVGKIVLTQPGEPALGEPRWELEADVETDHVESTPQQICDPASCDDDVWEQSSRKRDAGQPQEQELEDQVSQECAIVSAPQTTDDDSIEAHIAEFMKRMRGGASAPIPSSEPVARRRPAPVRTSEPKIPVVSPSVTPPQSPSPGVDETRVIATELERRPRADVKDLTAMRSLANTQARLALHTHSKRQLVRTFCMRAAGGAACLIGGFIVMNLGFIDKALNGCAMLVIVTGIYFLFLSTEDAKKVAAWFETRPVDIDPPSKPPCEPTS
jgi:hypothetical protein